MTQRHKGFSLIEVAIALAIFVIGALAIIRIFPTGLSLVEKSGNTQIATDSSRSLLARLSNEDAVPYATVNTDGTGNWLAYDGSVIGSSKFNKALPKDVSAGQLLNSALDRYQRISGEKVTVKNGGSVTTPYSYVLTQFSVSNAPSPIVFKVDTLENVTITGTTTKTLDFSNVITKSGVAFTQPVIGDTRTFYVTYRYKVGTNVRIAGVDDEPIPVGTDLKVTIPNTDALVGSVEVRVKEPIAFASTLTEELRCGLIRLTDTLPTGQELFVDYTTDWYWLLETLTPTSADDVFKIRKLDANDQLLPDPTDTHKNNYRQVELSIPFVQGRTSQRYATLVLEDGGKGRHFPWLNTNGTPPVVDDTLIRFPQLDSDSAVDYTNYRNTLREGKIGFDMTDPSSTAPNPPTLASPVVRVAYRTQDGWARQLSVSAKTYKPYNGTGLEPWRDYVQSNNDLYFHPSEAGKSVKVTYSCGVLANPSDSDVTKTELLTIGTDIIPGTTMGTGSNGAVKLTITPLTGTNVTAILSVKGASITARTAWLTNDKYNQSLLTSMRGDS